MKSYRGSTGDLLEENYAQQMQAAASVTRCERP